jgi:hypothetical protein
MSTATSSASSMHRVNTQAAVRAPVRQNEPVRNLRMGSDEAAVLKLDLTDLPLPQMGGLDVDGFKPSFFQRLFGKR